MHRIVVWNVGRLLRPTGSSLARALDATAAAGWDAAAYREKIRAVAAVLHAACPAGPPAVLALIEVQDAAVVRDLVTATGWSTMVDVVPAAEQVSGYDVATLYDRTQVNGHRDAASYSIGNRYSTRDVLDVTLDLGRKRSLRLVNVHWASRSMSNAEPLRIAAAWFCNELVSRAMKFPKEELFDREGKPRMPARSRLAERWQAPLIVTGDFNDNPWDTSVRIVGGATYDRESALRAPRLPTSRGTKGIASYLSLRPRLFNPTWALPTSIAPPGTIYYDSDWHLLDQFLLSPGVLGDTGPRYIDGSLHVFAPRTVTVGTDERRITNPNRTPLAFDAKKHQGASDHLPLVADFDW